MRTLVLFVVLVACQAAILSIGALALRTSSTNGVGFFDLVLLLVTGVQLPLLYFMLQRGARRLVAAVLAVCFALVVNVSFVATSAPAAAVTDNSSVFTFARTSAFASPNLDMVQNYTPTAASTTCATGAGWKCTFSSDQFSNGQQLSAGTGQADLYLQESASTPAFKSETHQGWVNGTACSQSVPTGTVAGDFMIYTVAFTDGGSFTVTPTTAGWTQIRRTDNGTTIGVVSYWKAYQAGDPATFNVTFSAQTRCLGIISTYSGVDPTTPIDVENGQTTANSTTHATPTVTTTGASRLLVTIHVIHAVATWTPPAGMTERVDFSNNGSGQAVESVELSDVLQPVAGATGAKTATATVADIGIAQIATLRPASSCGVTATLKHVFAPVYRAAASGVVNNGTTLTINKPSGVSQNDVLVASIAGSVAPITPSGWTLLDARTNGAVLYTYRRVAGASEAATYSWTLSSTGYAVGGITAYYNVDTTAPVEAHNSAATSSGTSHATPSLTTTQSDEILVASFATPANDTWTPPAGMTERVDAVTSTTFVALEVSDTASSAYGTVGPFTATSSPTAATGVTTLLALRPIATTVGSGASTTLTAPFGPALVSISFSGSAETFGAGDRLQLDVVAGGDCNASLSYDGASEPSKLTVATVVVPEGVSGLALLAPALPLVWRWRKRR